MGTPRLKEIMFSSLYWYTHHVPGSRQMVEASDLGHSVTRDGYSFFSLRLEPEYTSKKGELSLNHAHLRVLLGKDTDGRILILKVYEKELDFDASAFHEMENEYYKEALRLLKANNIHTVNPTP